MFSLGGKLVLSGTFLKLAIGRCYVCAYIKSGKIIFNVRYTWSVVFFSVSVKRETKRVLLLCELNIKLWILWCRRIVCEFKREKTNLHIRKGKRSALIYLLIKAPQLNKQTNKSARILSKKKDNRTEDIRKWKYLCLHWALA